MHDDIGVLALVGSFRTGSLNQTLLEAAHELAPPDMAISGIDLRRIPFYDGDLEAGQRPAEVDELDQAVRSADAVLLITPEYNGGLPAVLKNAIDWASRGYPDSALSGKIGAIMGATPGRSGTSFAQAHLRQVLGRIGMVLVDAPEVAVARAQDLVEDGRLADSITRDAVASTLSAVGQAVRLSRACRSRSAVV